jgi:hypothetical protein
MENTSLTDASSFKIAVIDSWDLAYDAGDDDREPWKQYFIVLYRSYTFG